MKPSRRNIITGGVALAAGAILPAMAAKAQAEDSRVLALATHAHTLLDRFHETTAESQRTYDLVCADPEWTTSSLDQEIERGSTLPRRALVRLHRRRRERLYARHGYDVAHDAWSTAIRDASAAVSQLAAMRARTVQGMVAKARLLQDAAKYEDIVDPEGLPDLVIGSIVADLERLAKGGAA